MKVLWTPMVILLVSLPFISIAQWSSSSSIVQLNNSNNDKSVIISESSEINRGKLVVAGNPGNHVNGKLVNFRNNVQMGSNRALLNLSIDPLPTSNPVFLEGTSSNQVTNLFRIFYNGDSEYTGKINLMKNGATGTALEVHGKQAIWFNGTEFSWGYEGRWNRFARPISIGASGEPNATTGLQIGEAKNLKFVGDGFKTILFRDGNDQQSQSEITSNTSLILTDRNRITLNAGSSTMMNLDGDNDRIDVNKTLDMHKNAWIQWGDEPHGSNPKALIVYESQSLGMVNTVNGESLEFITTQGPIHLDDGVSEVVFDKGNFGIGLNDPMHRLHVDGDVGITGEFYALSDRRLKMNINYLSGALVNIVQIRPASYQWIKKPGTEKIGVIAQDIEEIYPEAVTTDQDGTKKVNYDVFGVLAIQAVKELNTKVESQEKLIELLIRRIEKLEQKDHY